MPLVTDYFFAAEHYEMGQIAAEIGIILASIALLRKSRALWLEPPCDRPAPDGKSGWSLDWSEEGPRHWRIVLRCPECESRREGVFDQTAVERLDDELDRGSSALLGDLRRMTHANMSEEIEFFARALEADLILPSDF